MPKFSGKSALRNGHPRNHRANRRVLRITFVAILLVLIRPDYGMAQYGTAWQNVATDNRVPATTKSDRKLLEDEAISPRKLFNENAEVPIRRFKKQAIQKVTVAGGWMGASEGNDLNSSFFETSIGFGIPLGLVGRLLSNSDEPLFGPETASSNGNAPDILGITPTFRVDFIDASSEIDIPAELYDTGVSLFYRKTINDRFSAMAIVRPSVRSDFTTSDNAFRLFGLGLLTWECVPQELSLSFGAVSLGRADLPVLPAVGLTWTPRTTTRLELQFPQSRVSWRLAKDGGTSETWAYLSAGIGGNTWGVTRADKSTDELSLGDIRLLLGLDHIVDGGGGWFAECGFAFNRHIEYQSTLSKIDLSNGVILQAGWRY